MKTKNFLSVEQVKELALLGVMFEDSEIVYMRVYKDKEFYITCFKIQDNIGLFPNYPAPTLSEVLEKLPCFLYVESEHYNEKCELRIELASDSIFYWDEYIGDKICSSMKDHLIDSAFEILKWVATNHPEQINK